MSLAINFNMSAIRAHQNLVATDRLMTASIERLSSGIRISKAGDDPAALVLANSMRFHLRGLHQASSNVEEGVTMVQTAEGGMDQISSILTRMRTLALNAANEGVVDPTQLQALQAELDEGLSSITRIATTTQFGGRALLAGALSGFTLDPAAKAGWRGMGWDATRTPGGVLPGSTATLAVPDLPIQTRESVAVTFAGAPAGNTALQGLDQGGTVLSAVAGGSITITGAAGSRAIPLTAGTTIDDFVAQVNAVSKATGARAVYDATTGTLTVESTGFGSGPLHVTSTDLSGGSNVGLLDTDTTSADRNPLAATRDTFAMALGPVGSLPIAATTPLQGLTDQGTSELLSNVAGKTLTLYGRGSSATFTFTATTTIQETVDWVNAQRPTLGSLATYDPTTGGFTVTGADNPVRLASDDMTGTSAGVGLLDRASTTSASAGSTFTRGAGYATVDLTITDAAGTPHTITLVQDPYSAADSTNAAGQPAGGGLGFTNLLPGPELSGSIHTGWWSGAFRAQLRDTSNGTLGSTITSPTVVAEATRQSEVFIQNGASAGQQVVVEIQDLRAGALGHSAGLVAQGLDSLQSLIDTKALEAGNAEDALRVIDAAISEVSLTRGRAGALQAHSLEAMTASLMTSSENLTQAESNLRDTDFAWESAQFARHNIIYQAATAMLAQANLVPKTVLDLLRQ